MHDLIFPKYRGFDKNVFIIIIANCMEFSVCIRAPAKINLHLEVFNKRSDDFHDILSLFQAVDLHDEIFVRSLKKQKTIEIIGDFDCPPEKTTIWKAVCLFREASGIRQGLSIRVNKRIPAGAGLGGGSSDAAAVLKALNDVNDHCLSVDTLLKLSALIGSDVSFFLKGGAALATGRGEKLAEILPRTDYSVLIVFPGFPIATSWAYSELDKVLAHANPALALRPEEIVRIYRMPPATWSFSNSFQAVVDNAHSEIGKTVLKLKESGASFAAMTGSGSSIFGVFGSDDQAEDVTRLFSDTMKDCNEKNQNTKRAIARVCRPLASMPNLTYD